MNYYGYGCGCGCNNPQPTNNCGSCCNVNPWCQNQMCCGGFGTNNCCTGYTWFIIIIVIFILLYLTGKSFNV